MPARSGATSPTWTTSSRVWCASSTGPPRPTRPGRRRNPTRNDRPEELNDLIRFIEEALGRKADRIDCALPPGDVLETRADLTDLRRDTGFAPLTPLKEGVARFVVWYRTFHGL